MSTNKSKFGGFSEAERDEMKNRAKELIAEAKSGKNRAQGEKDILDAIAKMEEPDQTLAKRIHEIVKKTAPSLMPKTWYGMPAYAKDDKVVCFFQNAGKFKARYSTLGFNDSAKLDDGSFWPVAYAVKKLTPAEESKIAALVKKAVS